MPSPSSPSSTTEHPSLPLPLPLPWRPLELELELELEELLAEAAAAAVAKASVCGGIDLLVEVAAGALGGAVSDGPLRQRRRLGADRLGPGTEAAVVVEAEGPRTLLQHL